MITTTTETVEVTIVSPEGGKIAEAVSPREAYAIMRLQVRDYGHLPAAEEGSRPRYSLEARRWCIRKEDHPHYVDRRVTDDPEAWLAKTILFAVEDTRCDLLEITSYVPTKVPYEWGLRLRRVSEEEEES
ncbi:MAG: hypothetical protein IRZ06_12220 [Nevskia sp.]|nr:hypothetical protein [Nevskia sp.]